MYAPFIIFVQKLWLGWASIFSPLPYGDPYVAFLALFITLIGLITLALNISFHKKSIKKIKNEDDRLETWRKVMNVY